MHMRLVDEMDRRGITFGDAARVLGLHRNSIRNKLYGVSEFTIAEAITLQRAFFSDLCLCSLFGCCSCSKCREAERER